MSNPRVSIGLPVYNGEKYLAQAIESVLRQSYPDFELIISDNASTDRTGEICRAFAASDNRVRYHRNDRNLGAAANFNGVFQLARGEYFQWLAHDDLLAPDYLTRCVAVLDEDPSPVLCFSWVRVVDEHGCQIDTWELQLNTDAPEPRRRYRDILLEWHNTYYVFGLIRSSVLGKTKLITPYAAGDTMLVATLALLGSFRQIPEYLFISRYHPSQSNRVHQADLPRGLDLAAYTAWFDERVAKQLRYPYWRLMAEWYKTQRDIDLNWIDRIGCHVHLAHVFLRYRRGLLRDLKGLPHHLMLIASGPRNKHHGAGRTADHLQ